MKLRALMLCSVAGVALMRFDELGNAIPETDQERDYIAKAEAAKAQIADPGLPLDTPTPATEKPIDFLTPVEKETVSEPRDPAQYIGVPAHQWGAEAFDAWVAEVNRRVGL